MTMRFVIVAEDELGQRLVRDLADRVVAERAQATWLRELWEDEGTRASQRTYGGFEPETRWSKWGDVKRLADELSIRVHGLGMKAERAMAHKAVAIAAELATSSPEAEPIHALFLAHDTDGDLDVAVRLRAGARGRPEAPPSFAVVVAAPHPESEAWVVAGAGLRSPEEQARHREERSRLGFDPVTHPELLTANRATDKRDSKRVCAALLGAQGGEYAVWEPSWKETPLDDLDRNGAKAGLSEYSAEVAEKILPLLDDGR
jgi:hypothetical protein